KSDPQGRALAISKKHAGVLGLSAVVLAYPYDVPDFLPDVLEQLSRFTDDPPPIGGPVTKSVFDDFRRTHRDEWESRFVQLFTPAQLEAVESVSTIQSYFA